MTASVLFPLLALFLKYFRKIVSEKLHPCPHCLNIANNYCLLQNILPTFYPRWIDFHGEEVCWVSWKYFNNLYEIQKNMKKCFKFNEILDFNIHWKLRLIWTCFGNIIRKTENQFPSPVFLIKFIQSLWNQQYFAAWPKRFTQKLWNFCEMVFIEIRAGIEIWTQQLQGKGKRMETMLLRYQPLVTCNSRTALKSAFHSTEIANEWKWM